MRVFSRTSFGTGVVAFVLLAPLGCEGTKPSFTIDNTPVAVPAVPPPTPAELEAQAETARREAERPKVEVGGRTVVEGSAQDDAASTQRAGSGVGKQGHTYGSVNDPAAIFGTYALASYWRANERITFDMQIPHALNLFRATNDRFPSSLEEYTQEILIPNQVKLPELPADKEYIYFPDAGELRVRDKPKVP